MKNGPRSDRIKGAIIGALVGDALALGPFWFHSKEEIEAHFGPWVDDYTAPLPHRHADRAKLKPGENSQTGALLISLLESVAECGGYDEDHYTQRLDDLLDTLRGGLNSAIRDVKQARKAGLDWSQTGSFTDKSDAAIRATVLGARYATDLELAQKNIRANVRLTHRDPFIVGQSTAFALNVSALVMGIPIEKISNLFMTLRPAANKGVLPAERVPSVDVSKYCPEWEKNFDVPFRFPVSWLGPSKEDNPDAPVFLHQPVDAVYQFRYAYDAVHQPGISIEPAWRAVYLFGLPCQMGMLLPAAYYFAARFENDFETAVLTAVNSPGNNGARAALTGALSGAQVGLSDIPGRFIDGLADHERLIDLASRVAEDAECTK